MDFEEHPAVRDVMSRSWEKSLDRVLPKQKQLLGDYLIQAARDEIEALWKDLDVMGEQYVTVIDHIRDVLTTIGCVREAHLVSELVWVRRVFDTNPEVKEQVKIEKKEMKSAGIPPPTAEVYRLRRFKRIAETEALPLLVETSSWIDRVLVPWQQADQKRRAAEAALQQKEKAIIQFRDELARDEASVASLTAQNMAAHDDMLWAEFRSQQQQQPVAGLQQAEWVSRIHTQDLLGSAVESMVSIVHGARERMIDVHYGDDVQEWLRTYFNKLLPEFRVHVDALLQKDSLKNFKDVSHDLPLQEIAHLRGRLRLPPPAQTAAQKFMKIPPKPRPDMPDMLEWMAIATHCLQPGTRESATVIKFRKFGLFDELQKWHAYHFAPRLDAAAENEYKDNLLEMVDSFEDFAKRMLDEANAMRLKQHKVRSAEKDSEGIKDRYLAAVCFKIHAHHLRMKLPKQ